MIELKHTQPAGGLPLRNGLTSPGSVITSGLVLVLAMAITGCQKQSAEVELPPPVVRVAAIAPGTLAQPDLTGVIVAKTQSAVGFQVSGRIADRVVKRGAVVKAGEVLATLDDADFKAKQAAAQAQAQQAQAEARFAQQNFRIRSSQIQSSSRQSKRTGQPSATRTSAAGIGIYDAQGPVCRCGCCC
ncbi:MAG: hypothetical protein B7X37_09850 [Halothiobacillus sp. 14-55-98]|nr:MAG: hypothetical protein B7X37_09850 [Halothiobacillus sp. 14-55-98]